MEIGPVTRAERAEHLHREMSGRVKSLEGSIATMREDCSNRLAGLDLLEEKVIVLSQMLKIAHGLGVSHIKVSELEYLFFPNGNH